VIRDFAPGKPKQGYVVVQGSSSTNNLVSILSRLDEQNINVKVVAAISEELFDRQPEAYRKSVLPSEAYYDLMFVTTGTKRMWPLRDSGPLTDRYSLTADQDDKWLSGGLEADVIAEAKLDAESIFKGIKRFADDREKRIAEMKKALG
jgi:transketolase